MTDDRIFILSARVEPLKHSPWTPIAWFSTLDKASLELTRRSAQNARTHYSIVWVPKGDGADALPNQHFLDAVIKRYERALKLIGASQVMGSNSYSTKPMTTSALAASQNLDFLLPSRQPPSELV